MSDHETHILNLTVLNQYYAVIKNPSKTCHNLPTGVLERKKFSREKRLDCTLGLSHVMASEI